MAAIKEFSVIAFCLLLLIPIQSSAGEKRESCQMCGMYIDQYQRTACELVGRDGKTEHTCGVACMLKIVQGMGAESFRSIRVKDWNKGTHVAAREAWYAIGSQLVPDMMPNFIAFSNRKEAEAFAAEKGGTVLDFTGAMDNNAAR
jgi:nitrous oxide reductase accessory protein NosL